MPPRKKPKPLNVLQIGNLAPSFSTESHLLLALQANGFNVNWSQENKPREWERLAGVENPEAIDFVLWTRTGWDYSRYGYSSQQEALDLQRLFLRRMRLAGVPTVAVHLDVWVGLQREPQLDEPYFDCDLVCTADGGSDAEFARRGINHVYMLPGVSATECEPGMWRDGFASDIAFVGSWQGGYHPESQHRFELVRWLQSNFGNRCRFWPEPGRPAVRGVDLRDLYASVKIAVGDSCFAGSDHVRYGSDRTPESLGRGAYLLHPFVPGFNDGSETPFGTCWSPDVHYDGWYAGNWDALGSAIEYALTNEADRKTIAAEGRAFTMAHHTYERRIARLVEIMRERRMLR